MTLKIADLIPTAVEVEVAPGKHLALSPLSLPQIIRLVATHRNAFLSLYAEAQKKEPDFTPYLMAAPDLIVQVIGMAADAEDQLEDVARLPASVQLIAVTEAVKLSVPDAKKLGGLLSQATAALQKLVPNATVASQQPAPEANQKTST
jgi:hypothetical protein